MPLISGGALFVFHRKEDLFLIRTITKENQGIQMGFYRHAAVYAAGSPDGDLIPYLMASIIDKGVNAGDIGHIYRIGGLMIVAAAIGLLAGMAGGRVRGKGFRRTGKEPAREHVRSYPDIFLCQHRQIQHSRACDPSDN